MTVTVNYNKKVYQNFRQEASHKVHKLPSSLTSTWKI